jgi:hypothetical protein
MKLKDCIIIFMFILSTATCLGIGIAIYYAIIDKLLPYVDYLDCIALLMSGVFLMLYNFYYIIKLDLDKYKEKVTKTLSLSYNIS